MIKLLLADADEDILRQHRAQLKRYPTIKLVGSIREPGAFLQSVKGLNPNLIVADIRFFGIGAIQVIRDVHDYFPEIRFLIYGGFGDSEYMQKAMEYGVIDYMYKPVRPGDFDRCLNRAFRAFEDMESYRNARERLISQYKNNMSLFLDRFLINLLHGYITDESEITLSLQYFDMSLRPGFTVFIVRVDHFKTIILTLDEMEKHLLVYQNLLVINEKLKQAGNGVALINRFNSISVILGNSMELKDVVSLCESIKTEILLNTGYGVTIGIGRMYSNISGISISYNEAEAALRYRYFMGTNTVIPIDYVEPDNRITYSYPKEKEQMLISASVVGEYDFCMALLEVICNSLKDNEPLPPRLVSKIMMSILISISRLLSEQRLDIESDFRSFFDFKDMFEIKTVDEARNYLKDALKRFCAYIVDIRNQKKETLIEKVKTYIEENYAENITLAKMAEYGETSPEFLYKIFFDKEKCTVYHYTVRIRINKAKEIMQRTSLDDETIAREIGFDDVKQFRNLFRQHEGLYTHEYRVKFRRN